MNVLNARQINSEINVILKWEDIARHIKSLRPRWIWHVERMEREIIPKSSMQWGTMGTRREKDKGGDGFKKWGRI